MRVPVVLGLLKISQYRTLDFSAFQIHVLEEPKTLYSKSTAALPLKMYKFTGEAKEFSPHHGFAHESN